MLAPCLHICILVYVADAQLLPSEDVAACHEGSHACTGTGSRLGAKDRQQPESAGRQGTKAGLTRSMLEGSLPMCHMLKPSGSLHSPLQILDAVGYQASNCFIEAWHMSAPAHPPLASGNTTLTLGRQEWLNMEASR